MVIEKSKTRSHPAVTIEALLAGLQAIGIPVEKIRSQLKLKSRYSDPSELVSSDIWDQIWNCVSLIDPRPEVPTLAALHVPFGLFGPIDYLAGTSQTIRGAIRALADHFASVSKEVRLDVNLPDGEAGTLRIIHRSYEDLNNWISDEFTTGVIIGRFKQVGNFLPSRIYLTRSYLPGSIHERILGAPVVYEATTAGFDVDKAMLDLPLASADPSLFQLLSEVSKKLGLGMTEGNLESLIRSRLRDLLPQGISSAYRVAQSFGLSERTFHRKLKEAGLTFQDVLDQFRMEESEKFLLEGKTDFATIALELGYSDQSGWSRFFRRMRGRTPKQWLKQVSKL